MGLNSIRKTWLSHFTHHDLSMNQSATHWPYMNHTVISATDIETKTWENDEKPIWCVRWPYKDIHTIKHSWFQVGHLNNQSEQTKLQGRDLEEYMLCSLHSIFGYVNLIHCKYQVHASIGLIQSYNMEEMETPLYSTIRALTMLKLKYITIPTALCLCFETLLLSLQREGGFGVCCSQPITTQWWKGNQSSLKAKVNLDLTFTCWWAQKREDRRQRPLLLGPSKSHMWLTNAH